MDLYGALLTDKQRSASRMAADEDMSLSEIAEARGITRQGAHRLQLAARTRLQRIEKRLGFAARLRGIEEAAARLRAELTAARGGGAGVEAALAILDEIEASCR